MNWVDGYMKWVRRVLPSPFVIAVLLTLLTAVLAGTLTDSGDNTIVRHVTDSWSKGIWELLAFTMQMMLMLVLGHTIALSKQVGRVIKLITGLCTSNATAAFWVTLCALIAGYFNWGLGLIFGAILANKVGLHAKEKGIELNYPLIAACGYTALMVWHGGLSGSAPLTVNTSDHSLVQQMGVLSPDQTIFGLANIVAIVASLVLFPLFAIWLAKRPFRKTYPANVHHKHHSKDYDAKGAEKLDDSKLIGFVFGAIFIVIAVSELLRQTSWWNYFNLNTINFILFGIALVSHQSVRRFIQATETAIQGSTGIMIQFPLYAGIMGIMKYSGLLEVFADFFIQMSNHDTFPFFAFVSSAVVNVLVPSGGGQWQVQGPILIEAAQTLNVSSAKTVMALAYGDQITNMLQPFWALPLLGITGLKAKDILPYSLLFMIAGTILFISILYLF